MFVAPRGKLSQVSRNSSSAAPIRFGLPQPVREILPAEIREIRRAIFKESTTSMIPGIRSMLSLWAK
jgi:hypothetical protein